MAEPKKRLTSTRSGNRKSHLALGKKSLSNCPNCKEPTPPHTVCSNCGTYKGEKILNFEGEKK